MTIIGLIKHKPLRSILLSFLIIISAAFTTLADYWIRYPLDAIAQKNLKLFVTNLILNLSIGIVSAILVNITALLFKIHLQSYIHQLREKLVKHFYHNKATDVNLMQNTLANNLKILSSDYAQVAFVIAKNVVVLLFSIYFSIQIYWILLPLFAGCLLICTLAPYLLRNKLSSLTENLTQKNEQYLRDTSHWFGGLAELKRYDAKAKLSSELSKSGEQLEEINVKRTAFNQLADGLNEMINIFAQVGISIGTGLLFFNHLISFGAAIAAVSLAFVIFYSVNAITEGLTQFNSTHALNQKLLGMLQEPQTKLTQHLQMPACFAISDLSFEYADGEVIKYPDFNVEMGEKVLITGDSGVGKSTLFRLLLAELSPKTGKITYFDQAGKLILPDLERVGYIAQDAKLFPSSIKDNITMFNSKLDSKVMPVSVKLGFNRDLATLPAGLDTEIDLDHDNLSGGQKQKVILARSEIYESALLLMDEATSSIDATASQEIITKLLQSKKTIVMIAHNLPETTRKMFDKEIHLRKEGD